MTLNWLRKAEIRIEKAENSFEIAQGYYNNGDYEAAMHQADDSAKLFKKARFAAANSGCKVTKNRVKLGIIKTEDLAERAFSKSATVVTYDLD